MDRSQMQEDFFNQMDITLGPSLLFEYMPKVSFYMINTNSQYINANQAFLRVLGLTDEKDIIGKTNRDFFVQDIADKYFENDQKLMDAQKPVLNEIWLVPSSDGILAWYLCDKIPLFDKDGKVIGVAGTMRDYDNTGPLLGPYTEMAKTIKYINENYRKHISVEFLAEKASLSLSQFERKFKKLFHTTPLRYITKLRLNEACKALSQSDDSLVKIALKTGFCDQSYFTRVFTEKIGLTPKAYRKQYYKAGKK
jgi:PAS domain S-box-containing protein